jgi:hypothetical protein
MKLEAPVAEAEASVGTTESAEPLASDLPPDNANPLRPAPTPEGAPVAPVAAAAAWDSGGQATPTTPVASGIATLPSGMNKTMTAVDCNATTLSGRAGGP